MLEPERTALVLLAAGRSRRFDGDKLIEPFLDKPLAFHVVTALENVPFAERVAIVSDTHLDFAALGFDVIENPDPSLGRARSICHGVSRADKAGCDAVLIALADMPRVTATHVYRMFDASDGDDTIVASSDGVEPRAPALFGRALFPSLLSLDGEDSARALIRRGHHVIAPPDELIDVNTREDLEVLRERFGLESDGDLAALAQIRAQVIRGEARLSD